jgi:hypothetical protein|tara:strand:+ start:3893 stop:4402 length:510 start_codon:yes stop_codon:yes gene_type:complete
MIALDAVTPLSQIPTKPLKMQKGGEAEKKLAEGPPENINMLPRFEGFEAGPNQFELPQEEKVIPSEPNVIPQMSGNTFPVPVPKGVMPSEPNVRSMPGADRMIEGMGLEERMFNTPTIDPREVYPRDPDPFIQGFFDPMPQSIGGIPNLLQANMLKPLGILSINKTYNI